MAIYRAVLKGSVHGQSIINNLYYRTGIGIDIDGLSIGGADTLGTCIKDQVWPKLKECLPGAYTLETIEVYPFKDGTFDLMYQNPASTRVFEHGTREDASDGPAICAIVKFNLEPTVILENGIKPPKRGYVAVGPIPSAWINDTGKLDETFFVNPLFQLNALADALAANLESLLPPVVFFPVRVRQENILGVWKPVSYADVGGATVRQRTSFRRSRMVEN
jgi:hypothetical protein